MIHKKLSILVLDDSGLVRDTMYEELTALGHTTKIAGTTDEADAIIAKNSVDLLFLDLIMPGMSGLDYLEKIQEEHPQIIVVIITAYESTHSAVEAIEKGAYDYVMKPVNPGHLELIIMRALKRYEIEMERRKNIKKRIQALEGFIESAQNTSEIIRELKNEVNGLLDKLGRSPKYNIS